MARMAIQTTPLSSKRPIATSAAIKPIRQGNMEIVCDAPGAILCVAFELTMVQVMLWMALRNTERAVALSNW